MVVVHHDFPHGLQGSRSDPLLRNTCLLANVVNLIAHLQVLCDTVIYVLRSELVMLAIQWEGCYR